LVVAFDRIGGRKRLDALTSVRFFFAMFVLVGHFCSHFPVRLPAFVSNMAPMAVAWFFVLSGFIIAHNYPVLDNRKARFDFFTLRVARLWPVHAAILTFGVAFGMFYPSTQWLLFHYTMTQSWSLSPDIAGGYNGPAWSISVELFFYIVYIAFAAPQRWFGWLVALFFIAVGIATPAVHGCFRPFAPADAAECSYLLYMFPPVRLIEFVAGVVICRCKIRAPQALGLTAAVAVFLGMGWIPRIELWVNLAIWEALLILGGGLLIASLANDGWLSRLLSLPLLVIGGEISYSIYMTHQMVNEAILAHLEGLPILTAFAIVASVTILVSTLLFYALESPARNAVKRLLRRPTKLEGRGVAQNEQPLAMPSLDPALQRQPAPVRHL
jgi:peptidoglycan/LPS O-acetylase OafA/YrhL